jgi:Heterokaryon incompatibility protein (HET)
VSKTGASTSPVPAAAQETIKLGYIDEIEIKAATCPFCRLVVRSSQDIKFNLPDHQGRLQAGVQWQSWNLPKHSTSHLLLCLGVNIFVPVGKIVLLADDAPISMAFARFVPPKIDLKLLRCWMRFCHVWHGTTCDSLVNITSYRPWDSGSFRLIDVQKKFLVRRQTACKYIALSYVWGRADGISTLRSNVLEFEKPKAFASKSLKLPRTILDAIYLVQQLGEKYLWIDRLCIVQDDKEAKLQEINNMDKIYGNAFLTIIATGGDAEAGLPGLHADRTDMTQVIEEISPGLRLVLCVEWEGEIMATKYQSRAWTYVTPTQ